MVLSLAHSLNDTHVTSKALTQFAEEVSEKSDGRIEVKIYGNGQLGTELEVMEQLQAGVVDMARVAAPSLATYDEAYHSFGLPYIFNDKEHYYRSMDSDGMREFFESSQEAGFVTLTYYTSGARSFYTVDKAIREPSDLSGMKIRVQNMASQTAMMRALGGVPIVMAFGDIYTGLQTGIVDGAESNETVLTNSRHGEVTKVFSLDEHTMIPDVLIISAETWNKLNEEDRDLLVSASADSTEWHKVEWDKTIDEAIAEATNDMGVEFVQDVNKPAFQEATKPVIDDFVAKYPGVQDVLDVVETNK